MIEQRELLRLAVHDPFGSNPVGRQLPQCAKSRAADAVMAEGRHVEEVGRGTRMGEFQVGQRDPLREHGHSIHVDHEGAELGTNLEPGPVVDCPQRGASFCA